MGTCTSTSSLSDGASSKHRLSSHAGSNHNDELTSEIPDELSVDPLEKLGVSVHYLKTFLEEVLLDPDLSRDSTIYDCEKLEGPPGVIRQKGEDVLCPIDGQLGAAYVHCLDGEDEVGDANFMLSYSWGYSIGDIIDSLDYHCATQYLDPKRTYVWMCCLCVNQHRVVERIQNQRSGMLTDNVKNFEDQFLGRMMGIGHVLAMMAPWTSPLYLSRVWCIYELYAASEHDCTIKVITPPTQRKAFEADLVRQHGKGINTLYETIRETRVEKADASVESDRQRILEIVEQKPGFIAFNSYINDTCREWLGDLIEETVMIRGEGTKNRGTSIPFADFYNRVGMLFSENGDYTRALKMFRNSRTIIEKLEGKDHHQTAMPWIVMNERLLSKDHPKTAISYRDIGAVLHKSGYADDALIMYRRALAIQETALGERTDTAVTHKMIGTLLKEKGDLEGALTGFNKAKVINESIFGTAHLTTASSYNNIASVLQMKGDIDGAIMYLRGVANIFEKKLGKNHPDTALIYKKIGVILMNMRDYEGALVEHHKALKIYEAKWRGQHAEVASSHSAIGVVLANKGDFKEALVELDVALAIQKSVLGENHATTKETVNSIKNVREAQKDLR
eukprot:scaffold1856_cov56-Attheya_sp.AAC.2